MKAIHTILLICITGFLSICQAQTKEQKSVQKDEIKKTDSSKKMNLIDEQMKILGGLFATIDTGEEINPFARSDNYLEVVGKMEAPEEVTQMIREQYKVYDLSLDPTKKDSLKLMVDKMLKNALEKTQNKSQQKN